MDNMSVALDYNTVKRCRDYVKRYRDGIRRENNNIVGKMKNADDEVSIRLAKKTIQVNEVVIAKVEQMLDELDDVLESEREH